VTLLYVYICFAIFEETGVKTENVVIHLMMSRGVSILNVIMRRTMETNGCLGLTMQRTVLLSFRQALIIIMVYLMTDHHNSRCVVDVLLVL